jgi:hypothetical protein
VVDYQNVRIAISNCLGHNTGHCCIVAGQGARSRAQESHC